LPHLEKINDMMRHWIYVEEIMRMKLVKTISDFIAAPLLRTYYKFRFRHVAPHDKTIWINPHDITGWYRGNKYDEITFNGQIKGGDWSSRTTLKDDMLGTSIKHKILFDRFVHQKSWSEIHHFEELHKRIEKNMVLRKQKIKTIGDLEHYYEKTYGKMFYEIKSNGFLPSNDENPGITPMYVCIGPEGQLYWTVDGNHRLFMAMIIQEKKIPVKVLKRHKEWQNTRDLILSKQTNLPEHLENHKIHPDIVGDLTGQVDYDDQMTHNRNN
jgi:hypothetical protein